MIFMISIPNVLNRLYEILGLVKLDAGFLFPGSLKKSEMLTNAVQCEVTEITTHLA